MCLCMYIGKLTRIVNSETYQGKTIIEVKKKILLINFPNQIQSKKNQVVILLDNHYY